MNTNYSRVESREFINLFLCCHSTLGPGSSVGTATNYGLDGPGSHPGRDEIFHPSRPALGPTQPPVKWVPGLSRGSGVRGVGLTHHPHLECRGPRKSRAIPLLTLRVFVAYKKRVKSYLLYCKRYCRSFVVPLHIFRGITLEMSGHLSVLTRLWPSSFSV